MNLTKEDLLFLHRIIQKLYKTEPGIRQEGILESIIERSDLTLHGNEIYQTIYLKSASLMEGIIRLHPFTDGNKRTGLLATYVYLDINGYVCIYPLHSVRKSVMIAKESRTDQDSIDNLIKDIANWLEKYSAPKSDNGKVKNIVANFMNENQELIDLFDTDPELAHKKYNEWLAIDIYPEYKRETKDILEFLFTLNKNTINSK
jgi:death on curing protein